MRASTLSANPVWHDRKRHLWSLGAPILLLPVIGDLLVRASGLSLFYWTPLLFLYGVIPLLDWWIGSDRSNPPESAVPALEADPYYRRAVYAAVLLQYFAFVYGCWATLSQSLHGLAWLGMALGVGTVSGVGINTAHELGHKTAPLERWLAKIALAPVAYGHFHVEHNRGHHVRVATPEDPASARYGESFYAFLPRTMIYSLVSAWRLERARLARRGLPFWYPSNDLLQAWALTVLVWGALLAWLGWALLPFLLLQAFYGASLLEVVNYLEHYGLRRAETAPGRYERCQPSHSWNSNCVVTNLLLYQLQRHSDHHANPTRSYQALRHFDESPQLPSGYASMILLAYLPPLWFRVMNPRVARHYAGDLRRANHGPSPRPQPL